MKTQELILIQTDKRIRKIARIKDDNPPNGWIYAIRKALGISMRQLGKLADITPQGVKDIETREKNGNITLASLEQIGKKLNMKLVYGFVPLDGSLQKMIDKRAIDIATKIVARTANTMKLEDQAVSQTMLKKSIKAKAWKNRNL
ncbi:MAG: helix-turn-helix domain-containing protein [Bacteroidota bacterium]